MIKISLNSLFSSLLTFFPIKQKNRKYLITLENNKVYNLLNFKKRTDA